MFELALAGKLKEAFDHSRGVAAKHRQVAIAAVSKLIGMNVEKMREARDASVAMAAHTRAWLVIGAAAGLICAFGVLGWIALYQISRPLASMTGEMTKLADGDLAIQIEGADRADEVGGLARSLQVFKENAITARRLEAEQREQQDQKQKRQLAVEGYIAVFDQQVREALDTLSAASTEMHATAGSMSATAVETGRQATAVASASDQASSNVQTVAAATEQLHASTNEIIAPGDPVGRVRLDGGGRGGPHQRHHPGPRRDRTEDRRRGGADSEHRLARPTCWRSTRPSKPRGPVKPAGASRWWRAR